MTLVIRPATKDDIDRYYNLPAPTVRAWVGDLDGELIGAGGLALVKGRWFAFLNLKDTARQHKMALMRHAKRVMEEARRMNIKFIYVQPDPNEAGAVKWLIRLGFRQDTRDPHLYRWQACQD